MFVAPPEKEVEWIDAGLEARARFISRVWRLVDHLAPAIRSAGSPADLQLDAAERSLRRKTHVTIRRVTGDIDPRMHLNTAISALIELVNELYDFCDGRGWQPSGHDDDPTPAIGRAESAAVLREAIEALVLLLSPFTPHVSEELWERLGHAEGVTAAGWPALDEAAARAEEVEIPVQVNGKVRARITLGADATDADIEAAALASPGVRPYLEDAEVVKVVIANRRLANIVVRQIKAARS
jgi:leucyl-tRNA synthetase